jgi:hypothetical protein
MRLFSTPRYEKDVKRLLKAEEQTAMELAIVSDPEAHPVMRGMGGSARRGGRDMAAERAEACGRSTIAGSPTARFTDC